MGRLTALAVAKVRDAGMYPDGGGLYLQVSGREAKSWIYRFTIAGRARWMGLGSAKELSLADARDERDRQRLKIRAGIDPVVEKHGLREPPASAKIVTFKDAAESFLRAQTWKNAKHAAQWPSTLHTYVYPVIGDKPIDKVERADIIRILEPIWVTRGETARRVRGRIETVIDWAIARDDRLRADNPARRGPLEKGLPKQSRAVRHHEALWYEEVAKFVADLHAREGAAAAALEFLILTAARTGEVIDAQWSEIDFATRKWIVPATRMKAGREHRVPLSKAAVAVLDRMHAQSRDFIFPSPSTGKGLSNMTLLKLLDRMGHSHLTVHGFRACFKTWASERANFPREIVEAALAHVVGNKVEAAYQRGDLFEKRRTLMDAWADYCDKLHPIATVIPLRA